MAFQGIVTDEGFDAAMLAANNVGWTFIPSTFAVSESKGSLSESRTLSSEKTTWYSANTTTSRIDQKNLKIICTIPQLATTTTKTVGEVYVRILDGENNSKLLAIGQFDGVKQFDPAGQTRVIFQLNLQNKELSVTVSFSHLTEVTDHNNDTNAHNSLMRFYHPYLVVSDEGGGNYASIQDAIDALPSTGGIIWLKRGIYTINTVLNTDGKEFVWLIGQDKKQSILKAGSGLPEGLIQSNKRLKIENLTMNLVNGNGGIYGALLDGTATDIAGSEFRNIHFIGALTLEHTGVQIVGTSYSTNEVMPVIVEDCSSYGLIHFASAVNIQFIDFRNNWIDTPSMEFMTANKAIIEVHAGDAGRKSSVNIIGNRITNAIEQATYSSIGIKLRYVGQCVIRDNQINNTNVGIRVLEADDYLTEDILIQSNIFNNILGLQQGLDSGAIDFHTPAANTNYPAAGKTRILIKDNLFTSGGSSQTGYGIRIHNTISTVIEGNVFENNSYKYNIYLHHDNMELGLRDISIKNNRALRKDASLWFLWLQMDHNTAISTSVYVAYLDIIANSAFSGIGMGVSVGGGKTVNLTQFKVNDNAIHNSQIGTDGILVKHPSISGTFTAEYFQVNNNLVNFASEIGINIERGRFFQANNNNVCNCASGGIKIASETGSQIINAYQVNNNFGANNATFDIQVDTNNSMTGENRAMAIGNMGEITPDIGTGIWIGGGANDLNLDFTE